MMKRITLLFALLLAIPAAAAQVEDDTIRRYAVEVIVFRYDEDVATGGERFIPKEIPEVDDEFVFSDTPSFEEPKPEPLDAAEVVLLENEDLTLREAWAHIDRLDVYGQLMHFGWIQAVGPANATAAIPLARFAPPPAGLNGTLHLYLGNYLHLVVDLTLAAPADRMLSGYEPLSFRISEDRIFRSGEVRYFDHPKFGVIAKVTRVDND